MRIGAVIVLYHPDEALFMNILQELKQQVEVISVVDNSPQPMKIDFDSRDFHYHHFAQNKGIAAAQNVGLSDLMYAECEYGLILDQDSHVPSNLVQHLSHQFIDNQNEDLIAVGPRIVCAFSDKPVTPLVQRELRNVGELSLVTQIISSGMMISLTKLAQVGLKEDALFIDGVDHEWCWRARAQSYQVAIANNVQMVHTMGESRSHILGMSYKVTAPRRLYYQFRNILILSRRGYVPLYWKVRNLGVLPIRFVINLAFEDRKIVRIKYMLKGVVDGIRNRSGAYEAWH